MSEHTIDIGYVHVGRYSQPPFSGEWECANTCPHPSHGSVRPEPSETNRTAEASE